ncbi:ATP-binding protein [Saccharopolyspora hattusasensis]|uniref:ATP-binding protein n=1 Tax=Saccharopolyspora hattusasensis TaxID=1128679 RepID=UPI003D953731
MTLWVVLSAGGLAVAVLCLYQWRIMVRARSRNALLERDVRVRDEELRRLVTHRLPALVESLRGVAVDVPDALHPQLAGSEYGQSLESIVGAVAQCVEQTKTQADQSARATLKATMRSVQSLAAEQQVAISDVQERFDDPDVLAGLLAVDHANAQLGRRAQAIAVLCGSWPGQQRSASSLTDVVRGAIGRIRDYRRVQVRTQVDMSVVSRAVEPVVLAAAELLDNAARYSRPSTSVEVHFRPAYNGIAVVIDDEGIGMNAEALQGAERLLAGHEVVDISHIGDPPQIGFAVAGVLAARYGFRVSVDPSSPYGGVRAVVFVPNDLLTRPAPPPAAAPPAPGETAPAPRSTASGLPQRRRREPATQTAPPVWPTSEVASATSPGPASAASMGAWQRGTRSGRTHSTVHSRQPKDEGTTS